MPPPRTFAPAVTKMTWETRQEARAALGRSGRAGFTRIWCPPRPLWVQSGRISPGARPNPPIPMPDSTIGGVFKVQNGRRARPAPPSGAGFFLPGGILVRPDLRGTNFRRVGGRKQREERGEKGLNRPIFWPRQTKSKCFQCVICNRPEWPCYAPCYTETGRIYNNYNRLYIDVTA